MTPHDDKGMPAELKPSDLVRVRFQTDGLLTAPIPAHEINWNFPGDPVESYEVVK